MHNTVPHVSKFLRMIADISSHSFSISSLPLLSPPALSPLSPRSTPLHALPISLPPPPPFSPIPSFFYPPPPFPSADALGRPASPQPEDPHPRACAGARGQARAHRSPAAPAAPAAPAGAIVAGGGRASTDGRGPTRSRIDSDRLGLIDSD